MRSRVTVLLASAMLAASLVTGACSGATAPEAATGGDAGAPEPSPVVSLVLRKCTRCHLVDRLKEARHDRVGWTKTIERMRKKGVMLTDEEAATIADFFAHGGGSQL